MLPVKSDTLFTSKKVIVFRSFHAAIINERLVWQPGETCVNHRLIFRYIARESLGLICLGLALFGSAGRVDWWQG